MTPQAYEQDSKSAERLISIQDLHPLNKTINNFNAPNPYSKIMKMNLNPYNGMVTNKRAISLKRKVARNGQSPLNYDRDQTPQSPNHRGEQLKDRLATHGYNFKSRKQHLSPIGAGQHDEARRIKQPLQMQPFSKNYLLVAQEHDEKVRNTKRLRNLQQQQENPASPPTGTGITAAAVIAVELPGGQVNADMVDLKTTEEDARHEEFDFVEVKDEE